MAAVGDGSAARLDDRLDGPLRPSRSTRRGSTSCRARWTGSTGTRSSCRVTWRQPFGSSSRSLAEVLFVGGVTAAAGTGGSGVDRRVRVRRPARRGGPRPVVARRPGRAARAGARGASGVPVGGGRAAVPAPSRHGLTGRLPADRHCPRRYCTGQSATSWPSSRAARSGQAGRGARRGRAAPRRPGPPRRSPPPAAGSVIEPDGAGRDAGPRAHLGARTAPGSRGRARSPGRGAGRPRSSPRGRRRAPRSRPASATRLVERPAALHPVGGRDARRAAAARPATRRARRRDLERQPHAALEVAAVGVVAAVGERREELVQQVAVRHVQLDDAEAGAAARRAAATKAATIPGARRRGEPARHVPAVGERRPRSARRAVQPRSSGPTGPPPRHGA